MTKTLLTFKNCLSVAVFLLVANDGFAQLVWTKPTDLNTNLPSSVEVFTTTTPLAAGVPTKAYYTIADLTDPELELKVAHDAIVKTPTEFLAAEQREAAYVAINGGFFSGATSLSLVVQNGAVLANNIKSFNREYNGVPTPYFPTRGAFGVLPNNVLDVAWMYNVGPGSTMYSYPTPSPNVEGQSPQAQPTASFPSGGAMWSPVMAIGGAPVLVQNGVKNITDENELIKVDNTSRRARTAIGYTAAKKVILLVLEGGNQGVSEGATLSELADIMVSLGAVEALNLDGGGSSTMVVKGQKTIKPSDGAERSMPTAVIIKQKSPEAIIFDTEMTNVYSERGGAWSTTGNSGYYGESKAKYIAIGPGNKVAKYVFADIPAGQYEVSTWTLVASNRAKDTPFTVYQSGVAQPVVRVDQTAAANGGKFTLLGTYALNSNDSLIVSNEATGTASTYVTIDAIKLQKVGSITSTKSDVLGAKVNVYPVPTNGILVVDMPELLRKQGSITVFNLMGGKVLRKQNLTSNSVQLDLAKVPAGVYLVVLESPEGRVVKRIVKR